MLRNAAKTSSTDESSVLFNFFKDFFSKKSVGGAGAFVLVPTLSFDR